MYNYTMRPQDIEKKTAITNAVYKIVKEEGLPALSFGKIAKEAKVSPATPYVYFTDKIDMLSQIYLKVNTFLDAGLEDCIKEGKTLEERLFLGVLCLAKNFLKYPQKTTFLQAIRSAPQFVTEEALREGDFLLDPLLRVYREGINSKKFLLEDVTSINAVIFGPLLWRINEEIKPTEDELEDIIKVIVKGIIK